MRHINLFFKIGAVAVLIAYGAEASAYQSVDDLLAEVDRWIAKDTVHILRYIDSCNAYTDSVLKSSKYWESTYRELSFLLGIDYVWSPQIDNTGRIYFTMRITGETGALFYVDKPMEWPHQLTPNNWQEMGLSIGYFDVHPSGKYVLVGVMKHGNENFDVWLFERNGRFQPLLQDSTVQYSDIVFKNENQFFLIADKEGHREVLLYDIPSRKIKRLYSEKEWVSLLDYKDDKLLCSRDFSFSENQLFILDTKKLVPSNITSRGLFWMGNFTLDGRVITLTSNLSSKNEFMKFATIDLRKPKRLKLLYDPKVETDYTFFIKNTGITVASLNKDGYSELIAFDLKGNIVETPKIEIGVINSISGNDFGEIVYGFSSPRTPPNAFAFRVGSNVVNQITSVATFGFDFSNINVRVIRYRSSDGLEIPALLYTPANAKRDGNNPAIVVYHGGPPAQSRPYFQRNIAYALSKGFVLLLPNVRGSTGYGPAYQEMDDLEGRKQSLVDCELAIDYLVNEGWSNYNKIAIWGASYGGYVVNYLSVKAPDRFACAVSEVGVSDIDYTNMHSSLSFQKGWQREFGPIGSKLTRELSPIYYAENVQRPLLITAGFYDRRVPAGDPRRWAWVLKKLGKDILYYEEVKTGHGGTTRTQIIDEYTRNYVFTQQHIMK